MPKLLQICVSGNTGSIGRLAELLGERAINCGWESYIAFARNERYSKSILIKIGNFFDVVIHGVLTRLLDLHGFGSIFATKKLIKTIDEIKPDIIHLHNLHGYYINLKVLFNYLSRSKIVVVWTLHDCWAFTGHCAHFDNIGCFKWESLCNKCPQKSEYPSSYFLDRSTRNYLVKMELFNSVESLNIITVSKWMNQVLKRSFLSNIKNRLIYNGVDVQLFNSSLSSKFIPDEKYNGKFVILGVANPWSKNKGMGDFIKLSFILPKDVIIILIGISDNQRMKLPQNIYGISKTDSQHELQQYYSFADLYINFSSEESFGLTTIEALACGTPALVYNSTASPELINSETGFIVEKGDISKALEYVNLVKSVGKSHYSEKCRLRATSFFNIELTLNNYFTFYDELLNT
ncbi:glycosyltransferase [Aquirufa antheringensis]|uniref:glycosyltransferase n=1 Tax=Aquirufa antheringensis TaxID=2516559 RepID=UPI0022A91A99|nr:glycosyltransferase [Aquirufa antheringensis]MCZ2484739.1 glycosyltransferase [Aquirufa antheringensis]